MSAKSPKIPDFPGHRRSLVLEELLPFCTPALLNERNRFLMAPLQLACCDDAPGSVRTAELLVKHGARRRV